MLKRHTQIPLSDASPGMTLSDPILDTKGNLLLPVGTLLTSAILESLRRHQIDTVAIAGAEISTIEENSEREQRLGRVERLFRKLHVNPQPDKIAPMATETLYQHIRTFRTGSMT